MRGRTTLTVLLAICAFASSVLADEVGDFLDSFRRAMAGEGTVSAHLRCDSYVVGDHCMRLSGVVTWSGGANPVMLLTAGREEFVNDESTGVGSIQVSCRDGIVRLADCGLGAFYEEKIGGTGASLLASRLDVVFLVLMYPQLADPFRYSDGKVEDSRLGGTKIKTLTADHDGCHLEITVDAETFLPLRIVRENAGSHIRSELELIAPHVSSAVLPGSMFDVNGIFSLPRRSYDPTGLLALDASPDFSTVMTDGSPFSLSSCRGKWVFLCFRSPSDRFNEANVLYIDKAAHDVRARGGVFVDIYPMAASGGDAMGQWVPMGAFSCRSDVIGRMYGMNKSGLPCLVVVSPDGRVCDLMVGYIPNVSERAIQAAVEKCLPKSAGQ